MGEILEIKNIEVTYKSRDKLVKALDKITFSVEEGEFLSIIGPSGCGKTTLLNIIGGLLTQYTGEIIPKEHEKLGFIFQDPTLMPWRRLIDNVILPLEIKKIGKKKDWYDKAKKLLKLVGLEGFENFYPSELSGGMKQKVAIARALIFDPPLLLMDEPFGALDEITRTKLNIELNRIWRETNKTIVFVTHQIQEAVLLATRVIIISERPGKIKKIIKINLPKERSLETMNTEGYAKQVIELRKILNF